MIETLQRLIDALNNMPQTMDQLRQLGETIALYSKILFFLGLVVGIIWTLRMPVIAIVNIWRYREMRDIDNRESEAAEARTFVEIAKAKKGDAPITADDLKKAADDYYALIKHARASRKEHL